jgi:hypothetical protein
VKHLGQKPTDEMLTTAAYFAKGKPGKFVMALAMAMRPEGVTGGQMQIAVGDPKHNVRRELIKQKLITYLDGEGNVIGSDGHYTNAAGHRVYHVGLTAKGQAFIDRQIAKAAKAATVAADAGKTNGHPTTGKGKKPTSEPAKPAQVTATGQLGPYYAPDGKLVRLPNEHDDVPEIGSTSGQIHMPGQA